MGDELPNPLSEANFPGSFNVADAQEAANGLDGVQPIIDECTQIVAEIEDTVTRDIDDCINSCHGDVGMCQSCVLGDIADYINRAGSVTMACGDRIVNQVNAAVGQAWASSFELGIPPPTPYQIQQALAGQVIDFNDGTNGTAPPPIPGDGTGEPTTPVIPGGEPPVFPPSTPCPSGINPASLQYLTIIPGNGYCIPGVWDTTAIHNWCVLAFGGTADARVELFPTTNSPGIYTYGGCTFAIPMVCPPEITPPSPPPPVPGGNGTTPGNGNGSTPPATLPGGNGTDTIPSGGGGDTLPGGNGEPPVIPPIIPPPPPPANGNGELPCLTMEEAQALQLARNPQLPLQTAAEITEEAPCGYWELVDIYNVDGQGNFPKIRIGIVCDPCAVPGNGNGTTPPATPPTSKQKLPPGLIACDPDNLQAAVKNITEFSSSNQKTPSEQYYSFFGVNEGDCPTTTLGVVTNPLKALGCLGGNIIKSFGETFEAFVSNPGSDTTRDTCSDAAYSFYAITNGITALLDKFTSLLPPSVVYSNQGKLNYCFQYIIPSSVDAVSARARGYFTKEQAEFVWRFNGHCVPWQEKLVEASTTRIGVQDAFRLFRLGKITNEQFLEAWKRQGIDVDNELKRWVDAVQQYPPMSDLIRMMVRDTGDPDVVERLGLNNEFQAKWNNPNDPTLRIWGEAQGVSEAVAQKYWQAHWQAPSPTQIYEWLHRLRPDDRDENDPFKGLVFTQADAEAALRIADYVPGLIDNYVATSYRPLTRVDVRRMWEVGVFDSLDQVRRAYRDLGYNATNAESLAKFTAANSARSRAKLLGELSVAEISAAYRNNLITNAEARTYLERAGLAGDAIPTTLDSIDARKTFDSRKIALQSLQKRYNRGEFTDSQLKQQLTDAYMDPSDADTVVRNWSFQRDAKEKSPTVAMLCKWYGKGMITLDQMLIRVRNLRYNEFDALRIVESCNSDVQAKRQAEIEKALKNAQKEEQARNREAARLMREAKQQARELGLKHVVKRVHKHVSKNGATTHTDTIQVTDRPDVSNISVQEITEIHAPPADEPPLLN